MRSLRASSQARHCAIAAQTGFAISFMPDPLGISGKSRLRGGQSPATMI
jgi:hypothetical protein